MSSVLQSVVWFVVAIGVLVTVHEFGHYWVAKRLGVKVLRFSVGFGKPLYVWRRGPDQTEYMIAAVPLGGYVKMLDEAEGEVDAAERHRAFNRQPLATRSAVVSAGPLANFLFAILAYAVMYTVGVPALKPVIGAISEDSIAERAGLTPQSTIVAVAGEDTASWSEVNARLLDHLFDEVPVEIVVSDAEQRRSSHRLELAGFAAGLERGDMLRQLGIQPFFPPLPPTIGALSADGAAARAGLAAGDTIIAVDGEPVADWSSWVAVVARHPEQAMSVELLRGDQRLRLQLVPERVERDGEVRGFIGAEVKVPADFMADLRSTTRLPLPHALWQGVQETWNISLLTLKFLFNMIIGQASLDNLSSPISIAQYAGVSASVGWLAFVGFLAVVSVSLGILNLLPVPILDGGHLLFYAVEFVTGKPPSPQVQAAGQQIGIVLIIMLMSIALYNDLAHIFG